jgi:hypothetical protein
MNDIFTRYFTDAGFEVLGMEGMDTSPDEADKISTETIYQHLKASFNKFRRRRASICSAPALGVSKISLRRKTISAFP